MGDAVPSTLGIIRPAQHVVVITREGVTHNAGEGRSAVHLSTTVQQGVIADLASSGPLHWELVRT